MEDVGSSVSEEPSTPDFVLALSLDSTWSALERPCRAARGGVAMGDFPGMFGETRNGRLFFS